MTSNFNRAQDRHMESEKHLQPRAQPLEDTHSHACFIMDRTHMFQPPGQLQLTMGGGTHPAQRSRSKTDKASLDCQTAAGAKHTCTRSVKGARTGLSVCNTHGCAGFPTLTTARTTTGRHTLTRMSYNGPHTHVSTPTPAAAAADHGGEAHTQLKGGRSSAD